MNSRPQYETYLNLDVDTLRSESREPSRLLEGVKSTLVYRNSHQESSNDERMMEEINRLKKLITYKEKVENDIYKKFYSKMLKINKNYRANKSLEGLLDDLISSEQNAIILERTLQDPSTDVFGNSKMNATSEFLDLRDNVIKEFIDANKPNKESRKGLTILLYDLLLRKMDDFMQERIQYERKTVVDQLKKKVVEEMSKKLNITLSSYEELETVCKKCIELSLNLKKMNPRAKVYFAKKNLNFDTEVHELTNKQEVVIKSTVKPGLKFGSRTYAKAKVIVEYDP